MQKGDDDDGDDDEIDSECDAEDDDDANYDDVEDDDDDDDFGGWTRLTARAKGLWKMKEVCESRKKIAYGSQK